MVAGSGTGYETMPDTAPLFYILLVYKVFKHDEVYNTKNVRKSRRLD